jgi:hypothetical protein
MMPVDLLGLGCAFLSAGFIAVLAATDPKRRGSGGRVVVALPRWLLWLATFAPGVALGVAGRWSDVLIWVGAAALLGWAVAAIASKVALGQITSPRSRRSD